MAEDCYFGSRTQLRLASSRKNMAGRNPKGVYSTLKLRDTLPQYLIEFIRTYLNDDDCLSVWFYRPNKKSMNLMTVIHYIDNGPYFTRYEQEVFSKFLAFLKQCSFPKNQTVGEYLCNHITLQTIIFQLYFLTYMYHKY